jgi:6-phosphogluconolactonase
VEGAYRISNSWAKELAVEILCLIKNILREKKHCNFFLTGGRAGKELYYNWSKNIEFNELKNVNFYFGDERCVGKDHPESNFGSINKILFKNKNLPDYQNTIFRMEAERLDIEKSARDYAEIIPNEIDILLLGVGEDGHIASLFPNSIALNETVKKVVPIIGPKYPYKRLTITPRVIDQAKHVYILAPGAEKQKIYKKVQSGKYDYINIPATLVKNGRWILTK